MRLSRRIIACLLCIVTAFSFMTVSASAGVGEAVDYTIVSIWDNIKAIASGELPDPWSASEFWKALTGKEDYDQAVKEIETEYGTTIIDESGYLYWWPRVSQGSIYNGNSYAFYWGDTEKVGVGSPYYTFSGSISGNSSLLTFRAIDKSFGLTSGYQRIYVYYDDTAPIDGAYYLPSKLSLSAYKMGPLGSETRWNQDIEYEKSTFYASGSAFSVWVNSVGLPNDNAISYLEISLSHGPVRIKPVSGLVNVTDNSDTRVGTFSGNFGYYGDNGQLIVGENIKIVDETNNTVYNPVTGETSNVSSWTYDYSDRSYNVTTSEGDTITITYGDEQINYVQGDTIYNIYYVVPGSDDPGPSESTCVHNYEALAGTAPTCTAPGSQPYRCTLCGDTYTDTIPATGHTWEIKQSVTTQYDEAGNLLQEGYTIYRCSVCGEEYKDVDGTGPPVVDDSGGGSDGGNWFTDFLGKLGDLLGTFFGGLISAVGNVILGILDGLVTLVTSAVSSLANIIDLFGTFGEALRSLWSWLPPEIVSVMVAGVTVVIFAAVLKLFL